MAMILRLCARGGWFSWPLFVIPVKAGISMKQRRSIEGEGI